MKVGGKTFINSPAVVPYFVAFSVSYFWRLFAKKYLDDDVIEDVR